MPIARFQMPDGRIARFEVPEGTSPEDAQRMMEAASQNVEPAAKPKGGFVPALKAGFAGLKGDIAGLAGRTGIIDPAEAEAYQREQAKYTARTFAPTTKGWTEAPLGKAAELFGGSLPYMAAPVAAGAGAALAGAPALVGAGLAGAASAAQFTGSNLSRQQAEGKTLAGTDIQSAALAALPQAALDMVGLRMIPGIRGIFKAAGKEISEEAAARLAQQTIRQKAIDYAKATGTAMTGEGVTEAAQQVFERLQAGLKVNDPAAMKEYTDSFIGGAVLGGGMAPAGRFIERGQMQDKAQASQAATAAAQAATTREAAAVQAQQAEAAKQTPEYLKALDTKYRALIQQEQEANAAVGPKPDKAADPSAFMAWQARKAEVGKMRQSPEAAETIREHAERRGDIDALTTQEADAAQQAEQARQTAMEATADQPDTRMPVDTRVTPLDKNAQPDLFAEGQTAPSGAPEAVAAPAAPIEQQMQTASQALMDHENSMNALRDQAKAAVASGDMDAVVRHSTQANELAKQLKPLQDAVEKLRGQHKPSVDADVAKLKKKLQDAAEAGDTAKLAKIAAEIKAKQEGVSGQQEVTAAPAQNQARDAGIAEEMATGREQAAATTAKVGAETAALQGIAAKAGQPSEARFILTAQAKEAQGAPAKAKEPAQQPLEGVAETPGELSDQQLQGRVERIGETIVNPEAAAMEQQIREYRREQAMHKAGGREDLAAETQTKITALESRLRVNPQDADTVAKVDDLHRQLEQANNARESARAANNAPGVEEASARAKKIADQLAQVQKEPGSFAGRLVKAKNDVSGFMTAFFDAAHELHTSNMVPTLRKKLQDVGVRLHALNTAHANRLEEARARKAAGAQERNPITQNELERYTQQRDELTRQISALDRQMGALNTETKPKKLMIAARQAINKYVRASFREENIRREARQQQPLTGAERAAFAQQATKHAEDVIVRAAAARGEDYLQEHVVYPAQMRSGKVVKEAVTEWRDIRPPDERPFAKFGSARAVEEEAFHNERAAVRAPAVTAKRVDTGVLKRQWQQTEAKRIADERGEGAKTLSGQQRRRAEYLRNQLDAIKDPAVQPLRDALEESPTMGVMNAIEPLLHEARSGRMPMEADMNRVREAVALGREVRGDTTGQRGLFEPQTAMSAQGRIEDKQAANEERADEINKATYASPEDAAKAIKERDSLAAKNDKLDKEKAASKEDEQALKGEAARMATSFERTTPARFANAPEVKAGRAAADEQAKLVSDIHDQLQELAKADAAPSDFSKLAKSLSTLREQIAAFKAARPFAGLKGLMEGLSHRYAYMEPETLLVEGKEVPNPKYNAEQQAKIQAELDRYNKFVDDTNKFIAERAGTDTPEYQSLMQQLKEVTAAIGAIPTHPELSAARKLVALQSTALRKLLDAPEPKNPANRASRQDNIERTKDALRIAEGILKLKETTTPDIEAPARRAALAETAAQAAARRQTEAVAQKQRNDAADAAVEERMKMDEMQRRLEKLPATRRVTESESAAARLMSTGLRREAAGLERMLEIARKDGSPAEYVTKLEGLLTKSNLAYEQMQAQLPKTTERANESAREADLRVALDVARSQPKPDKEYIESLTQQLKDARATAEADDVLQPVEAPQFTGKQRTKKIDAAIAAAEALNEKQMASGRPVVTRKIGPGQGKTSATRGKRKENPDQAERLDAVGAEVEQAKNVREAQARVDKIEDLQERLAARRVSDTSRANKKKYDAYETKLDQEHADATAALERARGEEAPAADETAASVPSAERESTPVSPEALDAAYDGRTMDVAADLAANGSTPELRALAAKLQPLLLRTKFAVDENVQFNGAAVAGIYSPEQNKITMHPDGLTEQDVVHEMVHAATDTVLLADIATLTPSQREGRTGLENLWKGIENNPNFIGEHGATSVREFAAEVYTNDAFRAKLDAMGKPVSLLGRFKNFVRKLLGMPTTPSGKAMDFVDKVLSPSRTFKAAATPSIFRTAPASTSLAAGFGRDISKNRTLKQDLKEAGVSRLALAAEQKIVDQRASMRRAARLGDTTTGTQVMGDLLSVDRALQNMMRVAENGAFVLERDAKGFVMMKSGGGTNAKNVFDAVNAIPGANAAEKLDKFQGYMTALRARDVGWDKLDFNDPAGMQARGEAAIREVQSDPAVKAAMEKAQDVYHEYNKGLVRFLKETNAVPAELADKMTADRNYIPMFRNRGDTLEMVMQNGGVRAMGDIRSLPFLHALSGGEAKLLPFEDALFKNTALLTGLGVQNMTNRHIAYHLQSLGADVDTMRIQRGKGPAADTGRTVRFNDKPTDASDTGERYVVIDTAGTAAEHIPNDLLAQAVAGSYSTTPSLLKLGKFASDILRAGVTRMPTYMVSQLIKDPMNAAMMGNLKADPATATLKTMNGFYEHLQGRSPDDALLANHGVLQSNIFNGTPDDMSKIALQIAGGNQSKYRRVLAGLDKVAMSADAATRLQGYRDVVRAGGSELEAVIHAAEMQNFNKHGSSQSLQLISRMIPFFNAQIQGLNVLIKSATGKMPANELLKTKEAFFRRALGMSAMTLAYAAVLDDDPEWRKLSLNTQMANIPMFGGHIPAPFESGTLFYSMPIAFYRALNDNFNENDWDDVRKILKNQIPGNASLMPQIAKGAVDVARNYNSYFGSPIESAGMQTKAVTERFSSSTPEMMKALSRQLTGMGVELSPVQLDYLANAYLGQFPHMVGAMTNHIFETKSNERDTGEKPTPAAHDNPLLARFTVNPAESRNVSDAYAAAKKALLVEPTVKSMIKDGRGDEAREYRAEQIAKYGTATNAGRFQNLMGYYKRRKESITDDPKLDADTKRAKLDEMYAQQDATAADWLKSISRQAK